MNIPDRFNPRLWLRDWLKKPSTAEKEAKRADSHLGEWNPVRQGIIWEQMGDHKRARRLFAMAADQMLEEAKKRYTSDQIDAP